MPSCVVPGCKSRYEGASGIQYFSFPLKDSDRCALWITAVGKEKWNPTKWSKICSLHFKPEDYLVRPGANRKLLNIHAVPSLFEDTTNPVSSMESSKENQCENHEIAMPEIKNEYETLEMPTTEPPKYKSYIIISVDCKRGDNGQTENAMDEDTEDREEQATEKKIADTPKEQELKAKIKVLNRTIRKQRSQIQELKRMLKDLKKKGLS